MLFKTEDRVQTIDSEASLDHCIQFLKGLNLRSCSLHFEMDNLPSEKMINLSDLIKKQTKLKKLKLHSLSSKGFQMLCERSLIGHDSLTELELVDIWGLHEDSAYYLIQLIQHNTHLTSLSFCPRRDENTHWIEKQQGIEMGKVLEQNRCLVYFKLIRTTFDDPQIIAGIIENNSCLRFLSLEGNQYFFSAEGVGSILEALGKNKTLSTLNLCSNLLIFPKEFNKKIHLTNFEILKYPWALDETRDWMLPGDYRIENVIEVKNYRFIKEMVARNKQELMIQKYLFLCYLGNQEKLLNTDLIHCIFPLFLNTFNSAELKELEESISSRKLKIEPSLLTSESNSYPFLLSLGTSVAIPVGCLIHAIALLAIFGVINLSGAGKTMLLVAGSLSVSLGIYGFYKANSRQDTKPVAVEENSSSLNNPIL